jgi:large conductance mechanosensitive channel
MFNEFKKFLLRGNVVDLAVAVVVGAAFGAVVTALVTNLINPVIGLVGGQDFADLGITLKDATATDPAVVLGYGAVLSAIINFVLVAGAVFFLIVKPLNVIAERRKRGQEADEDTPAPTDEAVLLTEIRDLLAKANAAPAKRAPAKKAAGR